MSFVRIKDVLLHYRVDGSAAAPVLALVNSLGTDARIWDDVITLVSDRFRVISYDKRGHGLSDAPAGDYTINDHVDDLEGLLDHLAIDRLALAGVSIGGVIGQAFALRHSQRLNALVLCDTAARIGDTVMWNGRMAAVRSGGLGSIAGAVMARWFTEAFRHGKPDDLAGWQTMFERMPVEGYASSCAALRDVDLTEAVAGITTPTLVVAGDQDLSTPVDLVRATAEKIPGARFGIIADAGHIPSIEQPRALVALMTEFFEEVGHGR
ncbi:3-oxoadipate enol-lactonase [Devosia sp. SL43]|uniref:3-oxoadipate enol-lactonase n=1 Tax=Devosia sp. SL43 TaxID=2806348 RepID=UPI001EFFD469|nr:3-oxoadipate enol-lactonase [Devosia sp. SL43]UJW84204.1 3-oxoadipate enol-lactonase [Devosia sp. SL43]